MRSRIILNVLGLQTAIDCRNLGVGSSSRGPQRLLWRRIMALRRIRIQGSHDIRSRFPMTPASRLSGQLRSSGSGSLLVLANMLAGKACKLKLSHSRGRICEHKFHRLCMIVSTEIGAGKGRVVGWRRRAHERMYGGTEARGEAEGSGAHARSKGLLRSSYKVGPKSAKAKGSGNTLPPKANAPKSGAKKSSAPAPQAKAPPPKSKAAAASPPKVAKPAVLSSPPAKASKAASKVAAKTTPKPALPTDDGQAAHILDHRLATVSLAFSVVYQGAGSV